MHLEGMVSKRASAAYVIGASRTWLKIKCYEENDYEIAGVQRERGKPAMALMVDADRNYVGSAFITLNREMRERRWAAAPFHRTLSLLALAARWRVWCAEREAWR